ncbi:MAG: hypothetical protein F6K21_27785 [Symploca sp. SIO2D2]|nr:hypothetical protein [Symploca sp. SIO2D2]
MNNSTDKNSTAALTVVQILGVTTLAITATLNQSPIIGVVTAIVGGVPIIVEEKRDRSYKKLDERVKSLETKFLENKDANY